MSRYKRIAIYLIFVGVFSILFGTTYAFFNYTRTGASNELLVGNIYFNHTQGNSINLVDEFPEKKEVARARNDNEITLTITGYNESEKDIYYKLMLNHGDEVTGRNRIDDEFLKFDLIEELGNNEERYIIYNENFNTISNTILVKDRVDAGTSSNSPVTRTYRLRMWISDDILISDTDLDANYSADEFENLFASVKVMAKADTENVYYYDTFANVVTAINDETYESNTNRANANLGIYIDSDDNSTNLVLYNDVDMYRRFTITKPFEFNLYGYTFTFHNDPGYTTFLTTTADAKVSNGIVAGAYTDEEMFRYGFYSAISNFVGNNLVFLSPENQGRSMILGYNTIAHINNSVINTNETQQRQSENEKTIMYFKNVEYGSELYISEGGRVVIDDSTIFVDSPGCYTNNSTGRYYKCTVGIYNEGELIFNSGYVFGVHSAVETNPGSKTYVYGGTFESTDHGGFYFNQGPSGVAYIENANINGISYPANGKYRPNGTAPTFDGYSLEEAKAGFYIGGDTSENGEKVYLVNTNISAVGNQFFVLRYSAPVQNLYMSGCTFNNTRANQYLRVDNLDTMKMYFGYNNNFGNISNIYKSTMIPFETAKQDGIIIETNVDYKGIEKPE